MKQQYKNIDNTQRTCFIKVAMSVLSKVQVARRENILLQSDIKCRDIDKVGLRVLSALGQKIKLPRSFQLNVGRRGYAHRRPQGAQSGHLPFWKLKYRNTRFVGKVLTLPRPPPCKQSRRLCLFLYN